jgi:hypothetical protein
MGREERRALLEQSSGAPPSYANCGVWQSN